MIAGPTNAVAILLLRKPRLSWRRRGSADYIALVLTVTLLTGVFELVDGHRAPGRPRQFHLAHGDRRLLHRRGDA